LKTGTSKYFDDVLKSKSEGDKYKDK
jgi:hypothetical protein